MMEHAKRMRVIAVSALVLALLLGTGAVLFERHALQKRVQQSTGRLLLLNSLRRDALESLFETARAEITFWSMSEQLLHTQRTLVERWKIYADTVGDPGEALKRMYIEGNPYPQGQRREWADAGDGSIYSALHAELHPLAKLFVVERGYYDFFMITPDGDVFYTVEKEADFGSNVNDPALRNTGLANAYSWAMAHPDHVAFSDMERYAPSEGEPAMFMAKAMREKDGAIIGVLAFQLPTHRIKAIMNFDAGMGETGETYLVGTDFLMRSDSRFSETSTILDTRVDTPTVRLALEGERGVGVIEDYRGIEVLSAYDRIVIDDIPWAVMAEMDEEEVARKVSGSRPIVSSILIFLYGLGVWSLWYGTSGPSGAEVTGHGFLDGEAGFFDGDAGDLSG